MNRWWVDVNKSLEALSLVDDSDVLNGVGVALLGYHGLSRGVLKPLVSQTLIDVQTVKDALQDIDLAPVSKALSHATRPVMGNASERYGKLLAESIHKSAVEATEKLLLTWTNNGVAWPNAVERASEVHGVPLCNLGRYATVMKAVVVQPAILADYADRELMRYASDFAYRESVVDNTLVMKQEFNELDHPRGEGGRFTEKTDKEATVSDIRAIRDLRRKRTKNNEPSKKAEIGEKKKSSMLSDLIKPAQKSVLSVLKPKNVSEKKVAREGRVREGRGREGRKRIGFLPKVDPNAHIGFYDNPYKGEPGPYLAAKMPLYFLVATDAMENIAQASGNFYAGNLDTQSSETFCVTMDQLKDVETNKSFFHNLTEDRHGITENWVLCMAYESGYGVPVSYNDDQNLNDPLSRKDIVPQARFRIDEDNYDAGNGLYKPNYQTIPLGDGEVKMPVVHVRLDNKELFERPDAPIYKNLEGSELAEFNTEHPRGEGGRFSEKTDLQRVREIRNLRNKRATSEENRKRLIAEQRERQSLTDIKASSNKQSVLNLIKPKKTSEVSSVKRKREGRVRVGRERKAATRAGYSVNVLDPKIDFSKMSGFLLPIEDEMSNDTFSAEDLRRLLEENKQNTLVKRPMVGLYSDPTIFGDLLASGPVEPETGDPSYYFNDSRYLQDAAQADPSVGHYANDYRLMGEKIAFNSSISAFNVAKYLNTNNYFVGEDDSEDDIDGSWQWRVKSVNTYDGKAFTLSHDFITSNSSQIIIMGTDEECDQWVKGNGDLRVIPDVHSFNDLYSRRTSDEFDDEIGYLSDQDVILNPPIQVFTIKL